MEDYFSLHLEDDQIRAISSIGLAHLGDAVYELLVRSYLCACGRATGKGLHRAAVELVRAPAQAERGDKILPLLTDEETAVYKRGRNAHVNTIPHSASRADYLKATALECLFGYLYLRGQRDRINYLFAVMMKEDGHAA
ncbi:MAG: ribonuclease III [Oscillospiraceae bacterium]|nr:ribonuclease III [Oscillospiraceae bacterium]